MKKDKKPDTLAVIDNTTFMTNMQTDRHGDSMTNSGPECQVGKKEKEKIQFKWFVVILGTINQSQVNLVYPYTFHHEYVLEKFPGSNMITSSVQDDFI